MALAAIALFAGFVLILLLALNRKPARRCAACATKVRPEAAVCPACGRDFATPRPLTAATRGDPASGRKTCRRCGAIVNRDAAVCACGRDFAREPDG